MKRFFAAILAWLVLSPIYAAPPIARSLTAADMGQAPLTAVAVTQCNLLVAVYATLQTGELVKHNIGHKAGLQYEHVLAWGDTALKGAERVEANCDQPGFKTVADVTPDGILAEMEGSGVTGVTRVYLCGEVLAFFFHRNGGHGVTVSRTHPDKEYVATLAKAIEQAKRAGAPVWDVNLDKQCERT